jgi:hypothetical protein
MCSKYLHYTKNTPKSTLKSGSVLSEFLLMLPVYVLVFFFSLEIIYIVFFKMYLYFVTQRFTWVFQSQQTQFIQNVTYKNGIYKIIPLPAYKETALEKQWQDSFQHVLEAFPYLYGVMAQKPQVFLRWETKTNHIVWKGTVCVPIWHTNLWPTSTKLHVGQDCLGRYSLHTKPGLSLFLGFTQTYTLPLILNTKQYFTGNANTKQ